MKDKQQFLKIFLPPSLSKEQGFLFFIFVSFHFFLPMFVAPNDQLEIQKQGRTHIKWFSVLKSP